jgi:hypothetical protein
MLRSDPSSWQEALTEFLLPWRELDAVEGAVVTGSRVFGRQRRARMSTFISCSSTGSNGVSAAT